MKHTAVSILLVMLCTTHVRSQTPNARDEMKKFAAWPGHWIGKSTSYMQGKSESATADERIEWKVDGHALLINGRGTLPDGKLVHEALGVLSFDTKENRYRLHTWLRDGRSADAWFKVVGENNFQWGFDVPTGKIRYNIQLSEKIWNESGEYSADGNQWYPFFNMQLTKQVE
jgi:hypothetical protein